VPHFCIPDKDNAQAQPLNTRQDISHKVLIPSAEWQSNATNSLTIITSEDLVQCNSYCRVRRFYIAFRLNEQRPTGIGQLRFYIGAVLPTVAHLQAQDTFAPQPFDNLCYHFTLTHDWSFRETCQSARRRDVG